MSQPAGWFFLPAFYESPHPLAFLLFSPGSGDCLISDHTHYIPTFFALFSLSRGFFCTFSEQMPVLTPDFPRVLHDGTLYA